MRYADAKDLKRAQDLGVHSGAVHLSRKSIAEGKASSMALAITDKRKILGRLEAVASVWSEYTILDPFIDKCLKLWPNSQYTFAYNRGNKIGEMMRGLRWGIGIPGSLAVNPIKKKCLLTSPSGKLITGEPYEFDEVGIIIFNAVINHRL